MRGRSDVSPPGRAAESLGGREWTRDALVWLVGRHGPPVLPGDVGQPMLVRAQECFWEWLGRDAAQQVSAAERDRAMVVADRMVAELAGPGKATAVRCIDHAPPEMRARTRGAVGHVIDRAREVGAAPLVELGVAAGLARTLWDEPSETWVVLPSAVGLPNHRYVALRIVGDSMIPLMHSGDVVLVDLEAEVRPGMILVARSSDDGGTSDGYIVKRVEAATGATLQLSSLNPAYPGLAIPSDQRHILGPVIVRWCTHTPAAGAAARDL